MAPRLVLALVSAFGAAVSIGAFSCGGGSDTHGGFGGGGSNSTGSHHASGSNSGGGTFAGPSTGSSSCQTHCSGDLHNVVDCNGNVVDDLPAGPGLRRRRLRRRVRQRRREQEHDRLRLLRRRSRHHHATAPAPASPRSSPTRGTTPVTHHRRLRGAQTLDVANVARHPERHGPVAHLHAAPRTASCTPGEVAILFLGQGYGRAPRSIAARAGITPAFTRSTPPSHGTGHRQGVPHRRRARPSSRTTSSRTAAARARRRARRCSCRRARGTRTTSPSTRSGRAPRSPQAQPFIEIVAQQDGTQVTISPTAAIVGGTGVAGDREGRAEHVQADQAGRSSSSRKTRSSPAARSRRTTRSACGAAATCLNIDVSDCACDSAHQQISAGARRSGTSTSPCATANRYDGVEETPPWRIVGAVDGTTLTYEPARAGRRADDARPRAGRRVQARRAVRRARARTTEHPFYMSAHMTGARQYDPGRGRRAAAIPSSSTSSRRPSTSRRTSSSPTRRTRRPTSSSCATKGANGFADVTLDCAGHAHRLAAGRQRRASTSTRAIDLVTGNFRGVGGCDNGRHEITSTGPSG